MQHFPNFSLSNWLRLLNDYHFTTISPFSPSLKNWPNRCAIKTELHPQHILKLVFKQNAENRIREFSHKSEWITDTRYIMDATKWKKSGTKGHILYGSIYTKCPAVANPYTWKILYTSGCQGFGREGNREWLLKMGVGFLLGWWKCFATRQWW